MIKIMVILVFNEYFYVHNTGIFSRHAQCDRKILHVYSIRCNRNRTLTIHVSEIFQNSIDLKKRLSKLVKPGWTNTMLYIYLPYRLTFLIALVIHSIQKDQ